MQRDDEELIKGFAELISYLRSINRTLMPIDRKSLSNAERVFWGSIYKKAMRRLDKTRHYLPARIKLLANTISSDSSVFLVSTRAITHVLRAQPEAVYSALRNTYIVEEGRIKLSDKLLFGFINALPKSMGLILAKVALFSTTLGENIKEMIWSRYWILMKEKSGKTLWIVRAWRHHT